MTTDHELDGVRKETIVICYVLMSSDDLIWFTSFYFKVK
jgi:hypothetical protein